MTHLEETRARAVGLGLREAHRGPSEAQLFLPQESGIGSRCRRVQEGRRRGCPWLAREEGALFVLGVHPEKACLSQPTRESRQMPRHTGALEQATPEAGPSLWKPLAGTLHGVSAVVPR